MNTFEITADLRNELALQELQRKESANRWQHIEGRVCFAILVLVLALRWAGVL